MKTKKVLTSKQYVRKHGGICPVCRSTDISGGSIEVDGPDAWQDIACQTCGATWQDVYTLAFYDNLEHGTES